MTIRCAPFYTAIVLGAFAFGATSAQALTMKECSAKYKAAQQGVRSRECFRRLYHQNTRTNLRARRDCTPALINTMPAKAIILLAV